MKPRPPTRALRVLALAAATLAGCANFRHLAHDLEQQSQLAQVEVDVRAASWTGAPLLLVVMEPPVQPGLPIRIERRVTLRKPGKRTLYLLPGRYTFGAFEDTSGNERLEIGREPCGVYDDLNPVQVGADGAPDRIAVDVAPGVPPALQRIEVDPPELDDTRVVRHEGTVAPLSDPRFDPEHAQLGLWQPLQFLLEFGAGVFQLEPYDPERIPVLFVHGMGGHPREFEPLITALDTKRYQAWVAFYPSGWRLEAVAARMEEILRGMHARLGFARVAIVAHSMGGLVSRKALGDHAAQPSPSFVSHFVTLSSPLGGMPSADKGVEMAPAVVPSWRDVGPASAFIQGLYGAPIPDCTDYTLLFAYGGSSRRGASDGVVALNSQLRAEAQDEAHHEAGFETTHTGILAHAPAIARVLAALETDAGRCGR